MRLIFCLIFLGIYALAYGLYFTLNKGLSERSLHQQATRIGIASLLSMVPWIAYGNWVPGAQPWVAAGLSLAWMVAFPLFYHLANRKVAAEYDNQMDFAAGLYGFGLLSALIICQANAGPVWWLPASVTTLMELAMGAIIVFQIFYWALYHAQVDINGMKILQNSHINEVFEFAKAYPWYWCVMEIIALLVVVGGTAWANFHSGASSLWWAIGAGAYAIVMVFLIFSGARSPWRRCGVVSLFYDVLDYKRRNSHYTSEAAQRVQNLKLKRLGSTTDKPHTIMVIIGESACRDYMSAFNPKLKRDTTPWLSSLAKDPGTVTFPHAYSCDMHTVQVLEQALTEKNQYNDKEFAKSCSIIDIAHKLGYRVHWYSNQGHLGSFDTSVTLVAETADVAKWTLQEVNKVRYDEALLDFLDELDPTINNFLVVHLKGNHFNYASRYPAQAATWPCDENDHIGTYLNSIRYTDSVMGRIFKYAQDKLNLQAMVYFSDHATIPDKQRAPTFGGFGHTRIPVVTWMSPEYEVGHQNVFDALSANHDRYFTNDLAYELICGVLDISSEHFDATASLASPAYRFEREDLLTFDRKHHISEDTADEEIN